MKQKRISFPTLKDLDKPELFVSISDNVLDDNDYPVAKISLKNGFVIKNCSNQEYILFQTGQL